MIYKAYLKQAGEGCDYTIGCAQTVIDIEADSLIEASEKLSDIIKDEYNDEQELELCELYEINKVVEIDLPEWYNIINKYHNSVDKDELLEYERLKLKYENKKQ